MRWSRLHAATVIAAAALAGCAEERTFTPLDPSVLPERVARALDDSPWIMPVTLPAGHTGTFAGFAILQGERPWFVLALNWTSPTNHVTFAIHRTGVPGVVDGVQLADICSVPPSLHVGGSPIGAPLTSPLCPVVLSDATTTKPMVLEVQNFEPGNYEVVITNHGPANDAFRLRLWAN